MSHPTDNEQSFADLIGTVKKLDQKKINPYQQGSKESKARRLPTSHSIGDFELNIDKTDSIANRGPAPEEWFNSGIQKKLQKKIRQGNLTIDDHVDLHGFRLADATRTLESFIKTAIFYQQKMLLIIHGKGLQSRQGPVIKPMVLHWLYQNHHILGYCPAQIHHGGKGASYVYLR